MRKQHNKHISVQSNLFTRRSSESNLQNSLGNKFRSITLKQTLRIDFKAPSWSLWLAHGAHGAFLRAVGITGAGGRLHYWIPAIKLSRVELNMRILKTAVLQSVLIMRLRESVWFYLCVITHHSFTQTQKSHSENRISPYWQTFLPPDTPPSTPPESFRRFPSSCGESGWISHRPHLHLPLRETPEEEEQS